MKNKLQDFALIAEIISAIAIVLSLVFVGLQVSANSQIARSQVRESMLATDIAILQNYIDHPEVFEGVALGGDLQSREQQRNAWLAIMVRSRENYWVQYQNGILDEETFNSYMDTFINILAQDPFSGSRWPTLKSSVSKRFSDYVDERIEEINSGMLQ